MDLLHGSNHIGNNMPSTDRKKHQPLCLATWPEFLCTAAWQLLLCRIGNPLLVYLLQFSSIFVPLCKNNHYQVTGPPLNKTVARRQQIEAKRIEMSTMCFYCSMTTREVPLEDQIKRGKMYFNKIPSFIIFPTAHILNRVKHNVSGSTLLMEHIFGLPKGSINLPLCVNRSGHCTAQSCCWYHSLVQLLKRLIRNFKYFKHKQLLHKHCMPKISKSHHAEDAIISHDKVSEVNIPDAFIEEADRSQSVEPHTISRRPSLIGRHYVQSSDYFEQIDSHNNHHQVVSFVWAAIRSIVPVSLLGNYYHWRLLRKNISKFIISHRHEVFDLKQCIAGLEALTFPFFSNLNFPRCCCNCNTQFDEFKHIKMTNEREEKHIRFLNNLFRRWIHWLFSHMVVPLIAANFYVTEREYRKYELFYYPKSIWLNLVEEAVSCMNGKNFKQLNCSSVEKILVQRPFGFSDVRFFPKENNLRLLANLSQPSTLRSTAVRNAVKCQRTIWNERMGGVLRFKSVNSSLKDLLIILKRVIVEDPQLIGSSVFCYDDVYQKLHPFLSVENTRQFFIAVADVSKAFDSINQNFLVDILENTIGNSVYTLKKYARVNCQKCSVKIFYHKVCYSCGSSNECPLIAKCHMCFPSRQSVFIDMGENFKILGTWLHFILEEHLKRNILRIGDNFFLQKVGIPQGSSLSSLLSALYYGHMEKTLLFPYLNRIKANTHNEVNMGGPSIQTSVLMRYVDDYLFISTTKDQAAGFINRMDRGFTEYNCHMNKKKFGYNFELEQTMQIPNRAYTGADGVSFIPWSGLLVNFNTLEIQADYTRYCNINMKSTITFQRHTEPGKYLEKKLFLFVQSMCHPIFYDSHINSAATSRLNAYQAFLLCAMKFHCLFVEMKAIRNLDATYLVEILDNTFSYMHLLILKLMADLHKRSSIRPNLSMRKKEMRWLGFSAYVRVLKIKPSRHTQLLSILRTKIEQLSFDIPDLKKRSDLKYAVHDSHSSVFWKIKF